MGFGFRSLFECLCLSLLVLRYTEAFVGPAAETFVGPAETFVGLAETERLELSAARVEAELVDYLANLESHKLAES